MSLEQKTIPNEAAPARATAFWRLITCEYPPQIGGVSDYTRLLAEGLAAAGDRVDVWCPAVSARDGSGSVEVHDDFGQFRVGDLRRLGKALDRFHGPARTLVQWVPHGFGYWSMNLPFCCWLWLRSKRNGSHIEIMVHEPYLPFLWGGWRQNLAAGVHRLMTIVLMQSAKRVWVSIPAWRDCLEPYAFGRQLEFAWLPVPSNIPAHPDPAAITRIRERCLPAGRRYLLGHFGMYDVSIRRLLQPVIPLVLSQSKEACWLLIGKGSEEFRAELIGRSPELEGRIFATGSLSPGEISNCLSASDLLIQPYPDGVSSRRGSTMACLSHAMPVLSTLGALTEPVWEASGAIALVPSGDPAALAAAATGLIGDEARRKQLGAQARKLYEEQFDISQTVVRLRRASGLC